MSIIDDELQSRVVLVHLLKAGFHVELGANSYPNGPVRLLRDELQLRVANGRRRSHRG